ncbi:hypothetical protein Poli38472_005256 [Pythium oligandrum]|uniref:Phospholipid/glycerol acyltransferase domain-containing protein n=1 Tax=Pythium oligandrum TaxID=41045 RepID=A0A8K1FLF7_PYTOL|nr:hypothetical protein Poli38472_005256 [Pythium oligandrum]|eukprot:TMW62638.1 hypothetical protein Poli38472_005256 [Pythium oligandrum]
MSEEAPKKSVEEVLQEVRFAERLAEVEARLPTTLVLAKEGTLAKRNQVRRKLYRDSEIIRIEIEDKLNEYGIEGEWATSPVIKEANKKLDAVRAQLHLDVLPSTGTQLEKIYMFARLATFALVFVGWFSAVIALYPLRLLDSTLKGLGVPKNYLPMDIVAWGMASLFCLSAGSDFVTEGREHVLALKDSAVFMFSHASNLDGFVVNAASPVALKFGAKKSLFMIPLLGWGARWCLDYVAIDRSNRKSALASLKELSQAVNERGYSISISPEGTRSKDGLLQEFKKGPFYLRDDTKKSVVPALVFGAYELWPPGRLFATPGKTLMRFLPEFIPDPSKNRNQNRLALRRIYLDGFADDVPEDIGQGADNNGVLKNVFFMYIVWAITIKVTFTSLSLISGFCGLVGISMWTFFKLSMVVSVGLEALMFYTC